MLGKRLKEERGKRTQEEIAKQLGISRARYSHYENDHVQPDNELLQKMADLYKTSVDNLLGREKHPAEKLREYIDSGMSNEDIKKRMDFVVDVFELTDEEIDETISFLRWRLAERKKLLASVSKPREL